MRQYRTWMLCVVIFASMLTACGDGKHADVLLYVPAAKTDGPLPKLVADLAGKKYGINVDSSKVLDLVDEMQKAAIGGVEVGGTFILEDSVIRFERSFSTKLIISNFDDLTIAYGDIRSIGTEGGGLIRDLLMGKFYYLETTQGRLKFRFVPFREAPTSLNEDDFVAKVRSGMAAAQERRAQEEAAASMAKAAVTRAPRSSTARSETRPTTSGAAHKTL